MDLGQLTAVSFGKCEKASKTHSSIESGKVRKVLHSIAYGGREITVPGGGGGANRVLVDK